MSKGAQVLGTVYWLTDALVGLPANAKAVDKVKSRAIILWSFFALPVGMMITGTSIYKQSITVSSVGGLVGVLGILFAVAYLRMRKDTNGAGLAFGTASMLGLGIEPLVTGNTTSASLVLLAVTPVIFGLMVHWRRCVQASVILLLYYPAVYASSFLSSSLQSGSAMFLFACAASTFGCGFATGAFGLATSKNASHMRRQKDRIQHLALTDPLTGLENRRSFNEALAAPPQKPGAISRTIMLLDLNDFKSINDRFGHDVGDEILIETGHRITSAIQGSARLFRLGGDEFSVIFDHDQDDQSPDQLAQHILTAFRDPIRTKSATLHVSFSIGFDTSSVHDATKSKLLRNADVALFEAKSVSGSTWHAFTKQLGDRVERRRALIERLSDAINAEKIDVVYQPQHRITDGCVIGFEALARWRDAKYGDVPPDEFVRLAEENDLVATLDKVMIRKAMRGVKGWLPRTVVLSVNVSGMTLTSAGFVEFVERELARSSLAPEQLQLEITETSFIEKWESAQDLLVALKNLGVSLALDDFGTGYSSLSYLAAFPVSLLKIDKSFLRKSHQVSNLKVLQSIMNLAGSLDLEVLIEGVETEQHLSVVRRLGCQKVQGYFYSKPLSQDDCPEYVTAHHKLTLRRSA